MATQTIEQYLPKTAAYINSLKDSQRIGHHNHVISQMMLNTKTAIDSMSSSILKAFDTRCLKRLQFCDINENDK